MKVVAFLHILLEGVPDSPFPVHANRIIIAGVTANSLQKLRNFFKKPIHEQFLERHPVLS